MYPNNKYYRRYYAAYTAIFNGLLGEYVDTATGLEGYGVRGYSPIASGFRYTHYDDFGNSRSFGYNRKHTGHDMFGNVGTPVIAMEGGIVTELGWNRYGGWRVGVRSFDGKRYFYYAHLRKGHPYHPSVALGDNVMAGQVLGYLGATGYSDKEDTNLADCKPHLHVGMQLIFDESQVKGAGEIWIDMYQLTKFLAPYRAKAVKNAENGEWDSQSTKIMV
jgi:murein DD-endopeptidase MepM/ murein hydrolase activator NlpD